MKTLQTFKKFKKIKQVNKTMSNALQKCPQKKGICSQLIVRKPKKPNSAERKVAKLTLTTKKELIVYIPGEKHNLIQYSNVLVHGGRVADLPGVKYKIIRGKYDCQGVEKRITARSRYGTKKWLQKVQK
jgi:small subunit ribosomal protein S12